MWSSSAEQFFSQASKDGNVIKWSDLLDFYINLDKVKSFLVQQIKREVFLVRRKAKRPCSSRYTMMGTSKPLSIRGETPILEIRLVLTVFTFYFVCIFHSLQISVLSTINSRRETIVKIIPVSTGTSYVYIITSKFGHVGIYDDKLRLQRKYEIDIDTDPDSDLDVAASDPGWITDAVWMDNSKHMVYTSSLRTIHFFDASASVHYEEYRGFGLKNIPLCIDYWYDPKDPDGESLLMFGDDGGSLTIIRFSQPPNSLFKKDEVDSVQTLFWSNMDKHSEFATVQYNQV